MAGSDVTNGGPLRGFGIPYELTPDHIWTAKASYTEQGPTVGQAEPQGSYTLQLRTGGTQSASKELRVRVQRAGHPGPEGAGVIWQYEGDGATGWRGRDIQTASHFEIIRSTAAATTSALKDPDAVSFYVADRTDRICVVYERRNTTGSVVYDVEAAVYNPALGTWSTATVYSQSAIPTDGYHPAIAYNEVDGYLYVAFWIYDSTALLANVAVYRSLDGATWSIVSDYALDTGVDISSSPGASSPGYEVGRLRMAFSGGQCLLVGHVVANQTSGLPIRDWVVQYASNSRAGRFSQVDLAQASMDVGGNVTFSHHSVLNINGKLNVLWPGQPTSVSNANFLLRVELPSAFTSVATRSSVFTSTANAFPFKEDASATDGQVLEFDTAGSNKVDDGDGSVWLAEDGTVYGAFRLTTAAGSATNDMGTFLIQSTDSADSFLYAGDGEGQATRAADALIMYTGDAATHIGSFVGVACRGRQALIHLNVTDVTSTVQIGVLWLGGSTTVTLPSRNEHPNTYQRSSWTRSFLPLELPANVSGLTTSGAGTDTLTSAGVINRATSTATKESHFVPTSTIAQGLIVRYAHTLNSGGDKANESDCLKLISSDGSNTYEATLRFDSTGFRMFDDQGTPSQIGSDKTIATANGVDVLVAIVAGKFSCWFRVLSAKSDRVWTAAIQNDSLTDGAAAASANEIRFGVNASSSTDIDIHELHYMAGSPTNAGLGSGFTNPDDLFGRELARRGRFIGIDDGVQVTAIDGSGFKLDEFDIDSAAEHPIRRILHSESPSPRIPWRSVAVTSGNVSAQFIPFVLNPDASSLGSEEQGLGQTLCYMTAQGVNWKNATIERWDVGTTAWVAVATIVNAISTAFSLTRRGSELIVPSLPTTTTGHYFYENECAGWTVQMGSTYRKIKGNTAGTLASNISGPKPTFFLEDIDGSEPATAAISLIPDKVSVTFHTDGETGGGWGIRLQAQPTADNDLRIGYLALGRVFVFGQQYSRGRIGMFESGDITEDTPSGTRRSARVGPGGRNLRIAWPDPIDTSQTQGSTADPDFLKSTSTAGNLASIARHDLPFSMEGVMQLVGARTPVTYFPRIGVSTGSTDVQHFCRRHEHMTGQIASASQWESVLGDESTATTGELIRFVTVVLEELR